MKKSMIAVALLMAAGMAVADVAREADVPDGWCPFAIGLVPDVQAPGCRQMISPWRLNILVGRHLDVYGLDVGGLGNLVTHEFAGVQAAMLFNVIGESSGCIQCAGVVNNCQGSFYGAQFGLVNVLERGYGLQVGLLNYGNVFHGAQFGLINIIRSSCCPVLPVLNAAF